MLRLILPVAIILTAATGGGLAGYFLRPHQSETSVPGQTAAASSPDGEGHAATSEGGSGDVETAEGAGVQDGSEEPQHDYVKLNNQFVIPVVEHGRVSALVILSLSLEVPSGGSDTVFAAEPKLRDAFLQVLFDHANSGGFSGSFTESAALAPLRSALLEAGQEVLGTRLTAVLIGDIVRQDN